MSNIIPEQRIYELALEEKRHHETRRDEINNQYISLFAAIIAVTPFINNITTVIPGKHEELVIKLALIILSFIGLILSTLWSANLKRILFYLESLDKIIKHLEAKYDISFTISIFKELEKKGAPDRITKYHLMMPRMFIVIFSTIILYSISWILGW